MKTPEQIADRVMDKFCGQTEEARVTCAPTHTPEDIHEMLTKAIETDRAQRSDVWEAIRDDLRQIRRQDGDWRGVLDSLIGDECDECDNEATNFWPNLKKPVQLCDSCEHNARRSGWEPGQ